jgi:Zn finger protein HypA/HybF involved in hydrogenase expression
VQWVPLVAYCEACAKEFEVASPFGIALCPGCHQPTATLEQGLELEVDYLEVE